MAQLYGSSSGPEDAGEHRVAGRGDGVVDEVGARDGNRVVEEAPAGDGRGDGACPGVDAAVEERSDSPHTAGDDDASRLVARGEPPGVVDRVNVDENTCLRTG